MKSDVESVAILGGGPAGSSLATRLTKKNMNVVLFHESGSSPISIGESLIPGVIPHLRDLGVENDIESFSQFKPGAIFHGQETIDFSFSDEHHSDLFPSYAYNVPRNKFNKILLNKAREQGTTVVDRRVELKKNDQNQVFIDEDSLGEAGNPFGDQPDLIVDATGRGRLIANLLDLPGTQGDREDIAFFTHFDQLEDTTEGNIHIELLDSGWSWRIPLPDRASFGLVIDESLVHGNGEATEQLEATIESIPRLRSITQNSQRLEPVFRYKNQNWKTEDIYGDNWVLIGDAAGFADPILSSGLFIALESSEKLAEVLDTSIGDDMETYREYVLHQLAIWEEITGMFYDGRMMALFHAGKEVEDTFLGRLLNSHMEKHISRIVTGGIAQSSYSMWLIRFMANYGLRSHNPEDHSI